jgi:hypothetical protein
MNERDVPYLLAVLGLVLGLAILLVGEASGGEGLAVPVGGAVGLAGVALLTYLVARAPGGHEGHEGGEELEAHEDATEA